MKVLLVLALAILAVAHAKEEEHDYMFFPDGNGEPHIIDLKTSLNPADLENIERSVSSMTFTLYTRQNREGEIIILNNRRSLAQSQFSASRPTRIVTHGWKSSKDSDACTVIVDAFLKKDEYNVIVVDWSNTASQLYLVAANSVERVANRVARFINFLQSAGNLKTTDLKVIGHSLGGHIAGLSARQASGTVAGVVALDPALPLFSDAGPGSRVDASDAKHVQVIHTNGGLLGLSKAVGTSDFYPNGGSSQPGCGLDIVGSCAHSRAYYFYAESIGNPSGFRGTVVRSGSADVFFSHGSAFMGGSKLDRQADGSYSLTTNRNPPYAKG
ncbi:pancreatic triacylglycerol lipase [Cephus cinctus]|uniref:phospholipase A1 n=1 Tax=Cephus cinctus TaxID=211228 RepID=A0AAJ7BKZ2_CEPCN|nr:pancreatic triacylglycerol lipase [Cephus cinctus]